MRYGDVSVSSAEVAKQPKVKKSKKSKKLNNKEIVVPMVEEKKETNTETPVEGYHIEKTTTEPTSEDVKNTVTPSDSEPTETETATTTESETVIDDDDDDNDHDVHPEDRIHVNPSIALNLVSNKLTSALEQAVDNASNTGIEKDDVTDTFFAHAQNLAENNDPNAIFNMDFGKRFNLYGKGIYENTGYKYKDEDSSIKMRENSQKIELGTTFTSKSGNTKAIFLGNATRTHTNVTAFLTPAAIQKAIAEDPEHADEYTEDTVDDNGSENYNAGVFNVYLAGQQKFKNGDILTANGFYNNDGVQKSNTTTINGDYYLKKFGAHLSINTTIYNGEEDVHTNKTQFKCTFNPESQEQTITESQASEAESDSGETSETTENNNADTTSASNKNSKKKWKTTMSPFFDTNAIEGNPEEGLGLQIRTKKYNNDSAVRFSGFGKFSTTQKEDEANLYHITTGVSAKYTKGIGKDGVFQVKAEVKDKFTFCKGNILTATTNLKYSAKKISSELEGKFIAVPGSNYGGIAGRFSYTPNKNIHTYAEASYLNWKYPEGKIDGVNINAGVLVNF